MSSEHPFALNEQVSRRGFLFVRLLEDGLPWPVAKEAIASTALEHPEWDMDELHTFDEWSTIMGKSQETG